jgi:hypothetical protein
LGALASSFAWQVPHVSAVFGVCAEAPWQDAQSACPLFVEARLLSCAWQLVQSTSLFWGASKSCGLWQLVHGMPPACPLVSVWATFSWQLVHWLATAFTFPACG